MIRRGPLVLAAALAAAPLFAAGNPAFAAKPEVSTERPETGVVRLRGKQAPPAVVGWVAPARTTAANRRAGAPASTAQSFQNEVEPNETAAAANALASLDTVVLGSVFPNGDFDWYSFGAAAGDRVFAAVMTSGSANASSDSTLTLFASDGTTVVEADLDDGSMGVSSSSIAGATCASAGTYYLQVRHSSATNQLRPYHLHFKLQSGAATAEVEPNDSTATAQPLPASGWISGSTSAATDVDFYSLALGAGDTVFLSLDLDPERDTTEWNGVLGLGTFGSPALVATVNDGGAATPDSEATFFTVKDAGTYFVYVAAATTFGTYQLSVSVLPASGAGSCTTTASTDVPKALADSGSTTSTVTLPAGTIGSLAVSLDLTHANMPDLDITLTSPNGNVVGLLTDVGSSTQTSMNLRLDDAAAFPVGLYTFVSGLVVQPELNYRLGWFEGMEAGGSWTLTIVDDTAANTGTLNGWSLSVCPPTQVPACQSSFVPFFSSDFEATDGGLTHSGTADTWAWGTPTAAPITTCRSGTKCWKTNLTGTYGTSSTQDLVTPPIVISAGAGLPVVASWAHRFQMESASFDHYWVEVRVAGSGSVGRKLYEWTGATMTTTVGAASINESAGWAAYSVDISEYAGQTIEMRFHVDSDASVNLAGPAIDDVAVSACGALPVDLMSFEAE